VKHSVRQFAGGMRNPNGMDFNPHTGELWAVVNERDMLGPDLVPDYLSNVPLGAQYGWPWVYWKKNIDWRVQAPMPEYLMEYVRKPEYGLGAHVAPLGLAFARGGNTMGTRFADGAFVARHGSWNRRPLAGYDVVFVRFDDHGNVLPAPPAPVLTGFLTKDGKAHGRPTWVAFAKDGALLVSDDVGGVIWRVTAPGASLHRQLCRSRSCAAAPAADGQDADSGEPGFGPEQAEGVALRPGLEPGSLPRDDPDTRGDARVRASPLLSGRPGISGGSGASR
jgi:hypothetical protein